MSADATLITKRHQKYPGSILAIGTFVGGFVGLVLLVLYLPAAYRNAQARQWPVVQGRVITSRTVVRDAGLGGPGTHQVAGPEIRYRYEVNGHLYESETVSFVPSARVTPSLYTPSAEAKYPEGAAVNVMYDAAQPSVAVLETPRQPYVPLASGVALITLFLAYQVWPREGSKAAA